MVSTIPAPDAQRLRHVKDVTICIEQPDCLIDQCHGFVWPFNCDEALNEGNLKFRIENSVTRRVQFREACPKTRDAAFSVTPSNRQGALVAARNGEIRPQGMRSGMRDQLLRVLRDTFKISGPKECSQSPGECESKRCRVVAAFGVLQILPYAFHGLSRVTLQP